MRLTRYFILTSEQWKGPTRRSQRILNESEKWTLLKAPEEPNWTDAPDGDPLALDPLIDIVKVDEMPEVLVVLEEPIVPGVSEEHEVPNSPSPPILRRKRRTTQAGNLKGKKKRKTRHAKFPYLSSECPTCPQCHKFFRNLNSLKAHIQRVCGVQANVLCAICDHRTKRIWDMKMHVQTVHGIAKGDSKMDNAVLQLQ